MKRNKNLFPAKAAEERPFASIAFYGALCQLLHRITAWLTVQPVYVVVIPVGFGLVYRQGKYVRAVVFVPPVKAPVGRDLWRPLMPGRVFLSFPLWIDLSGIIFLFLFPSRLAPQLVVLPLRSGAAC